MACLTYPTPKEAGFLTARQCLALDGGWVVIYDRTLKGPAEFHAAWKPKGAKGPVDARYSPESTKRYILLYRADPDECRTWAVPGKWVGTDNLGEAKRWLVAIASGDDPAGVLPVADGSLLGGLNQRQFLFCQHVLCGKPHAEAYRLAGYKSQKPNDDAAKLVKNSSIARYLELQRAKAVKRFTLTKEEMLVWLVEVKDTPAGAIDKMHPLCEEYTDKPDEKKVKMPGKMPAAKTIIEIMGWSERDVANDKQAEGVKAIASVLKEMVTERIKRS